MTQAAPGRRFDALIVDFGGVLTTPLQDAFAGFADSIGLEISDLVRVMLKAYAGEEDDLVTDFETGRLSEEDFSTRFAQRLSEVAGREIDPIGIVGRLFHDMRLEESMFDAVRAVRRAGYRTGLLSNSWGTTTYPLDLLDEVFDVVVISGEVGMRKPQVEIFELTTDKLDVDPRRSVFVDDHSGHLKTAQEVGMTTVLHRSPEQTIPELAELFGVELSQR
ncbi:MAG: putative hydrolase of the superfamily [Actinomycetota bacterium]|nr:putative hydrolase of the superfamily [Actinomycetota bacterium]